MKKHDYLQLRRDAYKLVSLVGYKAEYSKLLYDLKFINPETNEEL